MQAEKKLRWGASQAPMAVRVWVLPGINRVAAHMDSPGSGPVLYSKDAASQPARPVGTCAVTRRATYT